MTARSLYAETAGDAPAAPVLDRDRRVSVVVVGGGFTGLSAALHLAQRGVDVVVVEAREIGWGASGRNGGQVNPGLKSEPDQIEAQFGRALGGRMVKLSGNAPDRVFELIREHQIQCEARQDGTIRAAFTAGSVEFLARATESLAARDAPVDYLDRTAIAAATGTDRYVGGAIDRRGGSLNPLAYSRGLAQAAVRAGATIHAQTKALSVSRNGKGWAVVTPGGTVTADWLVLGTNAYTDNLWPRLRRSVVPVYSGIVATEPLPAEIARQILPGRSVVYEHESVTVYYRIDARGRLLMGGRSKLRDLDGPADLQGMVRYARRLFPVLGDTCWTHGWNGQVALTTDHFPHLDEPAERVISCLGYNGRGVAMATVMGNEIARRISGTAAADLDMPVGDIRTFPFHRFWPIGVTARIAYGRLRMRLGR